MNGKDRGRRRPFRGRYSERLDRTSASGGGFSKDSTKGTQKWGDKEEINRNIEKTGPGNLGSFEPRRKFPEGNLGSFEPRRKFPEQNERPLPVLNCIRCSLPIQDHHSALSDRKTGEPVHFDCVMAELTEQEKPEGEDVLCYLGGGRFGIIRYNDTKGESKSFTIKKILEWEDKEKRAEWRSIIAEHYSVT